MQSTPLRDFIVGLFVVAGLAAVGYLAIQLGGASYGGQAGMELRANFTEIGGLSERSPVTISGVRIGQVKQIVLSADLDAQVIMDVDAGIELPVDTAAAIRTSGLLGDQFVALEPGAEDELLKSGDTLGFTENALNIEKLVGGLVHGADLGGE
jgi:phospholipid/cholesterol/gamma-HCH transport system substrate-binding protein